MAAEAGGVSTLMQDHGVLRPWGRLRSQAATQCVPGHCPGVQNALSGFIRLRNNKEIHELLTLN